MLRRATACLAAGVLTAAAAVVDSSPGRVGSGCRPISGDVVCRVTARLLTTRHKTPHVVRDNAPHGLTGPTLVQTSGKGSADLFLGMQADCRMAQPTKKGTILKTRYPRGDLFSQKRGKTLCTFSQDYSAVVLGIQTVRTRTVAQIPSPLATIKTEEPQTQFRTAFSPTSSLAVSVKHGQLIVALRGGREFELGPVIDPHSELVVSLDPRGHVTGTRLEIPFFPTPDAVVFGAQRKAIG
jgi:hypothetical protein